MTFLLDTHVVLWSFLSPGALSQRVSSLIADPANEILVSAGSAWEIANKVHKGKLPGAEDLERDLPSHLQSMNMMLISIDLHDALRAARFTAGIAIPGTACSLHRR